MAFWDFLAKLVRGAQPAPVPSAAPPPRPPAALPTAKPQAAPHAPPPRPSDFLPISRDDLLKQGEDVRRNPGWMWFGRRDMIPPVSDPRTLLIDRGLVTQGLLTPDELAEMHRVGDEWHKYANRLEHI